jgi:hypothetical protein
MATFKLSPQEVSYKWFIDVTTFTKTVFCVLPECQAFVSEYL